MAKVRIHAGDFLTGQVAPVASNNIIIRKPGFWGRKERLPLNFLDAVEIASEESVKRVGGTLGWGLAGGVLLGPVGLLAGLLVGGRGKNVTFVARFQDGRRLLGTTDAKTFTRMQAAVFNRKPAVIAATAETDQSGSAALPSSAETSAAAQEGGSSGQLRRVAMYSILVLGGVIVIAASMSPPTEHRSGSAAPVAPANTLRNEPVSTPVAAPRFDPNAMRDPGAVCAAPAGVGIPTSRTWRPSNSTPGGYVCVPLGAAAEFGPAGPFGMPTNVSYFGFGSGERKLDRATLKLNVNNLATADEGKRRLIEAAQALARVMEMRLPENFSDVVRAQRSMMLREVPRTPTRVLLTSRQDKLIFEVAIEQTRLTTVIVHFKNEAGSNLW